MDYWKESMPNIPDLKLWNYDTSANIYHDFKYNGMDPMERPTKIHFDKMNYIMPQFEKVCCTLIKKNFTCNYQKVNNNIVSIVLVKSSKTNEHATN